MADRFGTDADAVADSAGDHVSGAGEHEHGHGGHEGHEGKHGGHLLGKHGGAQPAGEAKKKDRRDAIIVFSTVLMVIIGYLTLRKGSGAPANAQSNPAANPVPTVGQVAGTTTDPNTGDIVSGFGQMLANQGGAISQLQTNLTALQTTVGQLPTSAQYQALQTQVAGIKPPSVTVNVPPPAVRGPAGITAQAVLKPHQTVAQWAAAVHVPVGSVQRGPGGHVWSYAPRS